MIVVFDASVLVYLFDADARARTDPATGLPLARCQERIAFLVSTLQRQNAKIVIPTPALAEILVKAGDAGAEWLRILNGSRHFRIAGFDERAAVEFAEMQAERVRGGAAGRTTSRTKSKFDDQIVAIAAVENATTIYSDDTDIEKLADGRFAVIGTLNLPLPPEDPQRGFEFGSDKDNDHRDG